MNGKQIDELNRIREEAMYDLAGIFRLAKGEPGISLDVIAEIIKDVFDKSEVDALIRELTKDGK